MISKQIEVYINIKNEDKLIGCLFVEIYKGKEVYSFEYDESYLAQKHKIFLDSSLLETKGRQYKFDSDLVYGFIADTIPDRWGKNLLNRSEKLKAKEENRQPQILGDSDYLLGVSDYTRQGALRFKLRGQKEFLATSKKENIPTLLFLNKLEQLAYNLDDFDDEEIKNLFYPGSSLGGARPKATVFDNEGNLFIAKFAHKFDDYDVSKFEMLSNKLAIKCGLNVPECKLVNGQHSIFLSKRFDRNKEERFHYVSAMTLLDAKDGENSNYSYLNLVDLINKYSFDAKNDLLEMFKRLVFNCIIHNGDDHLRNHGFILKNGRFSLSPVFDINPNPTSLGLTLSIDGFEHSFNFGACESVSIYFGLSKETAKRIIDDMKNTVKNFLPKIIKELQISKDDLNKFKYITA